MAEKALYFIAIVPPEPVYSMVMDLKVYMEEKYGTRKALNSPPHITLQMPFQWREDQEDRIMKVLKQACLSFESFEIKLLGFGFFEPRVVYVDVQSNENLANLQMSVSREVRHQLKLVKTLGERPFRPHMTIAFRDLKKPMFYKARDEFESKEFKESFAVNSVELLKHNGKSWDVYYSQTIRN